ncbi:MAG: hypothetical protein MZU91_02210 [Desulfosudis oleivorans]|nr:hypothetical protein [Desulfosudis oleivorans]
MATTERKFGFTTRQLHSGYDPDAVTGSRAAPIYLTTAYDLQSTERAARLSRAAGWRATYTRASGTRPRTSCAGYLADPPGIER